MIAICPAGPPKEMKPSFTQKRSASPKLTRRTGAAASLPPGLSRPPFSPAAFTTASITLRPSRRQVLIEAVEDRRRLPDEFPVVGDDAREPPHREVDPGRLQPVELVVLKVYVVNNLGDLPERGVARQAELFDHSLEGA